MRMQFRARKTIIANNCTACYGISNSSSGINKVSMERLAVEVGKGCREVRVLGAIGGWMSGVVRGQPVRGSRVNRVSRLC